MPHIVDPLRKIGRLWFRGSVSYPPPIKKPGIEPGTTLLLCGHGCGAVHCTMDERGVLAQFEQSTVQYRRPGRYVRDEREEFRWTMDPASYFSKKRRANKDGRRRVPRPSELVPLVRDAEASPGGKFKKSVGVVYWDEPPLHPTPDIYWCNRCGRRTSVDLTLQGFTSTQ